MANIPDPNLRLLLLDCLWTAQLLPAVDKKTFYREQLGAEWDKRADYNYEIDERVRDALLAIPLPDDLLAKLTLIEFGGNRVFSLIWTSWGGETDDFDVHDLTGIEAAPNVEDVNFDPGVGFTELAPLRALQKIKNLTLRSVNPLPDLSVLVDLPALERLNILYQRTPKNADVIAKLRDRGVVVTDE